MKMENLWMEFQANGGKNGQIWIVKTWKDGLCQGETLWHENGARMREDLYEKGEKISVKAWNDDGTETET